MKPAVFDSSAIIAALAGEPGGEKVRQAVSGGTISSVNLAEVVTYFASRGHGWAAILDLLDPLHLEVAPLDANLGIETGLLAAETREAGLSLGDRACLALARARDARVLTSDRAWLKVGARLGFEIEMIR